MKNSNLPGTCFLDAVFTIIVLLYNIMSQYPGHREESKYWTLIRTLIGVLEKRVMRFYQNRVCNEHKFFSILHRLIAKIEKWEANRQQDTIFHDSVNKLINLSSPFNSQSFKGLSSSFKGMSSMSQVSLGFDDKNSSQVSFDYSVQQLPKSNFKVKPADPIALDSFRKKRYYSYETVEPIKAIDQADEEYVKQKRSRSSVNHKFNQIKKNKMKLHPPKIGPYIESFKEEALAQHLSIKRPERKLVGEPYLGQRRKKERRLVRVNTDQ